MSSYVMYPVVSSCAILGFCYMYDMWLVVLIISVKGMKYLYPFDNNLM